MGILDGLKSLLPNNRAVKSGVWMYGANDWLLDDPAFVGKDLKIARTDHGAATAAVIQEDIYACLEARVNALSGLEWQIRRYEGDTVQEDDEVLCSSEDQAPRHTVAKAINKFRRMNGFDLFTAWYYSSLVAGKMFIEPQMDILGSAYRQLQWYNPTGMVVQEINGRIVEYRYNGDGEALRFRPDEIIYDRKLNLLNENIGMSPVMAAIDSINLDRTYKQQINNFFQNGLQLGYVFSVKAVSDDGITFTDNKRRDFIKKMRRENQGNRNAGQPIWLPDQVEVTAPQQPNLQQNDAAIERASNRVHKVLRTPRAITGDMSEMPYQQHKDMYDSWMDLVILPDARHIATVVNDEILPLFDDSGDTYFMFNDDKWRKRLTENDLQRQQLYERHLRNGAIDIRTYQRINNLDEDDAAEGVRFMPLDAIMVSGFDPVAVSQAQAAQAGGVDKLEGEAVALPSQAANTEEEANLEPHPGDQPEDDDKSSDELSQWYQFAKKPYKRDFKFVQLDTTLGDEINERHKAGESVDAIYDDVKPRIKQQDAITEHTFLELVNVWDELGLEDLVRQVRDADEAEADNTATDNAD